MKLNCKYIRNLRLTTLGKDGGKLTMVSLATAIESHAKTIMLMETDKHYNPGIFTVAKMARYFNVSIESLLVDDSKK
jgi:DNA-binding XRE family transcriptional regulator